jgi:hypothetical protein
MKFYPIASMATVVASLSLSWIASSPQVPAAKLTHSLSMVAQIRKDLNTRKLKVGDKVSATIIQDMISSGKVVIPRGASLTGHVSAVTRLSKAGPRARLAIVFDSVKRKGGALSLHGFIQALAPPLTDPKLEAIMSSSSYGGSQSGHPVNGGLTSGGQTNTRTPVAPTRRGNVNELQDREKALDDAANRQSGMGAPHGALTARSRGIFGLPGLGLSSDGPVPVIVTVGQDIELKSGTQIVVSLDDSVLQK